MKLTDAFKDKVIETVISMFPGKPIMFIYLCGAHVYGAEDENSDYDISVMLKDFYGYMHMETGEMDFFVYGEDYFLEKQRLSPHVPLYNRAHMDEVIGIDSRLIYLNPVYKSEYESYKNVDFNAILPDFLRAFVEFHEIRKTASNDPAKRLYHILRIRGQLDSYDETGVFSLNCKNPWRGYYLNYKKNWHTAVGEAYKFLIDEQLEYIKAYSKKVSGAGGL